LSHTAGGSNLSCPRDIPAAHIAAIESDFRRFASPRATLKKGPACRDFRRALCYAPGTVPQ